MERNYASKIMSIINDSDKSTSETRALGILLEVQLDIRDQNQKIVEHNDRVLEQLEIIGRTLNNIFLKK